MVVMPSRLNTAGEAIAEVSSDAPSRGTRSFDIWVGGEGGIRTPGGIAPTPDFESGPFNRTPAPLRDQAASDSFSNTQVCSFRWQPPCNPRHLLHVTQCVTG